MVSSRTLAFYFYITTICYFYCCKIFCLKFLLAKNLKKHLTQLVWKFLPGHEDSMHARIPWQNLIWINYLATWTKSAGATLSKTKKPQINFGAVTVPRNNTDFAPPYFNSAGKKIENVTFLIWRWSSSTSECMWAYSSVFYVLNG